MNSYRNALMTWEETIEFIRDKPEWQHIVEGCYYDARLEVNVERFRGSEEFRESLRLLGKYISGSHPTLIDIGAGNGVAAVAFALEGFEVTALEPDPSATVGSGAIEWLKQHYQLTNLTVVTTFGESIPCADGSLDIVYARQAMHHARNLEQFVTECARVLRKGGIYFANRDHVVNDQKQLEEFLAGHPLHKYYQGENAFSLDAYKNAISQSGLRLRKLYAYHDNVILYDKFRDKHFFRDKLAAAVGPKWATMKPLQKLYKRYLDYKTNHYHDEAGRCYSFIAQK